MREFAKFAGISYVTLSHIETGKVGASPEMLEKLAAALKCAVEDISEALPFKPAKDPADEKGIPVVGVVNAESFNFSYDMPPETHLPLRLDLPGPRRAVALRISGDCMVNPDDPKGSLYDGDYVVIIEPKDRECPNGKIAVIRLNGENLRRGCAGFCAKFKAETARPRVFCGHGRRARRASVKQRIGEFQTSCQAFQPVKNGGPATVGSGGGPGGAGGSVHAAGGAGGAAGGSADAAGASGVGTSYSLSHSNEYFLLAAQKAACSGLPAGFPAAA